MRLQQRRVPWLVVALCAGSATPGCELSIPMPLEGDGGLVLPSGAVPSGQASGSHALPTSGSNTPNSPNGAPTGGALEPGSSTDAATSTHPMRPVLPDDAGKTFPVGLEVRSLLATQDVGGMPQSLGLQAGLAMGRSLESQIASALGGNSAVDCAVQLPPQERIGSPNCYGPSIAFDEHPDGTCNTMQGTDHCGLPGGDLGIWEATDATGQACTAAKINADIDSVGNRVHSALLIAASAACSLRIAGTEMPAAGTSSDATTGLQTALETYQPDVIVTSAVITNEAADGKEPQYLYTIEASLAQRAWKFSLRHVPGDGAETYRGRLWGESTPLNGGGGGGGGGGNGGGLIPPPSPTAVALPPPPVLPSALSAGSLFLVESDGGPTDAGPPLAPLDGAPADDSGVFCPPGTMPAPTGTMPPRQGNMPPPPPPQDGGALAPAPPPSGCVYPPPPPGTNQPPPGTNQPPPGTNQPPGMMQPPAAGGSADVFAVHYELTLEHRLRTRMLSKGGAAGGPDAFTEDGDLATTGGWDSSMSLTLLDVDKATGTGKGAYLWQAGPNDNRTRVFNVFTEASASGDLEGCGFFGFGQPFGNDLPKLQIENFICNWAGPGNDHDGVWATAQKQCMTPDSFGLWAPTESLIEYSPQNSCASSTPTFKGGLSSVDPEDWEAFPSESQLVSLESDVDYVTRFGDGPVEPSAP